MSENENKKTKASPWRSIKVGLIALLVMVIFAYGFQITQVDFEELQSEQRQSSLVRVIRALARPEFFEYDRIEEVVNTRVYVPCPQDETLLQPIEIEDGEPYMVLTPACGEPGDVIQVEGFNFEPDVEGPLRFIPGNDEENIVELGRATITTDAQGHFLASFELPNRLSDDYQFVRVTARWNVGTPYFTQTAKDTWEKIIETVFLALLATVAGTMLAIPMSFIAARNLMKPVKSPLLSVSLSLIGWPIGIFVGYLFIRWIGLLSDLIGAFIWVNLISIVGVSLLVWFGIRWAIPEEEEVQPQLGIRILRYIVLFLLILVSFFGFFQFASLGRNLGTILESALGSFGFLGYFLFQLGDIIILVTPLLGGLAAGAALGGFLGRIGLHRTERATVKGLKIANLILTAIAGAIIFLIGGLLIDALYEVKNNWWTIWGPLAVGAGLGLLVALVTHPKKALQTGMVIYYITRTFLNSLRSVEALVMAIVFVIAVGIGPFAGVLALGLHTIVSLAKLYSEQVESILAGPLEAVEATGANRLQTIVYAVIPQIVPPYISYTMYRWDINVRMSTIIGFVGGGGIGFLLQQNINLLNYRAASAQMIAIAVVVALMDYVSSVLREKFI